MQTVQQIVAKSSDDVNVWLGDRQEAQNTYPKEQCGHVEIQETPRARLELAALRRALRKRKCRMLKLMNWAILDETEEDQETDPSSDEKKSEDDGRKQEKKEIEEDHKCNYNYDADVGDLDNWMKEAKRNFERGELELHHPNTIFTC